MGGDSLDDQVIVLTGAAAGIGRSVTRAFVAEGARVVAVDVSTDVDSLATEYGDRVVPVVADVSRWEGNIAAAAAALDTWGRIDVFVGNAAITDSATALEEIDGDRLTGAFHEVFGVNVLAPLLGVRACLDALVASRGSVVLTGSFASTHAGGGGSLYTASKHAVHGLIRQLAYELAPDVRVNGVAPGVAPTRLKGTSALGQTTADSVLDGTQRALPLQEIAPVSAYDGIFTLLASRRYSAAMTGTLVTADSGLSVRGIAKPGGRVPAIGHEHTEVPAPRA
ncbi:2,3-dihydroxy-2,3-dihydrophenylpropionate [Rhodococcus rhodnii LMG 5362]|uniref:2,3-dihydroxy-2,3-dihydrophenylpropionate n=1 Tax=Rhodococcus rhodnii LMG 5362 TaxID=1273125 RepID=R7WQS6_9NOCA|nr:SDR family oxidoreductase [Rhodococcus rhodnii]EOM77677.1 2,3-dihydroxy-2,3-dihydrophenylpropionate [Rhodococcus rhodnii LMG 5362]